MSTERRLFGFYLDMTVKQRIHHLMGHYQHRDYYEQAYRRYIEGLIVDIRSYERSRGSDAGVRIMSGGSFSDITSRNADEALLASRAFDSGTVSETVVKDKEDRLMINAAMSEWLLIRDDYDSLNRALWMLEPSEHDLIMDFLSRKKSYKDIADDFMIEYDSARKKLQRIRSRVVKLAAPDFERHCSDRGRRRSEAAG